MTVDPNNPEVLVRVSTLAEATAIATALSARGVEASTIGSYTAGFLAEAPGTVDVVVRQQDLVRAQGLLQELRDGTE
ncbi:MAG TPA: hypothetical protein DCY79_17360 [Planctomycetaceae bacterium]|nr:hypothetical protein [Planctomycetaceae bacterium]